MMNAEEDALATWELLTADERKVLAELGRQGGRPGDVARACGLTRNRVVFCAGGLVTLLLIHIRRMPKQVTYELSSRGRACLAAGREAAP